MPSRKIPKNYRSVTGTFPSFKNHKNISYESLLERDFYLLLEFNDNVIAYEEQPLTLQYKRNNKTYKYTPDALVQYKDDTLPTLYEIKMSTQIKDGKIFFKEKLNQIEDYVRNNDMDFKVFTELDIDSQYLENIMFLYRYRDLNNSEFFSKINSYLNSHTNITVQELLNKLDTNKFKQAEYLPYIWSLIFKKKLLTDMNKKITNSSLIKVFNEKA